MLPPKVLVLATDRFDVFTEFVIAPPELMLSVEPKATVPAY